MDGSATEGSEVAPYAEVAVAFASALVDGNFALAESMIVPELRPQLSRQWLRTQFFAMFRKYANSRPRSIHFIEQGQLEQWPGKLQGDVGRAIRFDRR
jgi:hypothetical protein